MITIGGAILILIVAVIGIIVLIIMLNREKSQAVTYDFSPKSIVAFLDGGGWVSANCEADLQTGHWYWPDPQNSDLNYVHAKTGGLLSQTYPIYFDPKDKIELEGRQGKILITGFKHLKLPLEREAAYWQQRYEQLINVVAEQGVKVSDMTMKTDQLIEKHTEQHKKAVVIPFVKMPKGKTGMNPNI